MILLKILLKIIIVVLILLLAPFFYKTRKRLKHIYNIKEIFRYIFSKYIPIKRPIKSFLYG